MKQQVLTGDFFMETQTVYHEDGVTETTPLDFEMGQHIVSGRETVRLRGSQFIDSDGRLVFRPYALGTGYKPVYLFQTENTTANFTRKHVIIVFRFCRTMSLKEVIGILMADGKKLRDFLRMNYECKKRKRK